MVPVIVFYLELHRLKRMTWEQSHKDIMAPKMIQGHPGQRTLSFERSSLSFSMLLLQEYRQGDLCGDTQYPKRSLTTHAESTKLRVFTF